MVILPELQTSKTSILSISCQVKTRIVELSYTPTQPETNPLFMFLISSAVTIRAVLTGTAADLPNF